jgi:uncharacterized protein (DUF1330 family)
LRPIRQNPSGGLSAGASCREFQSARFLLYAPGKRSFMEECMTRGYWVAFADVSDPEGYKAYVAENAKAFRKYGGRFLTRGAQGQNPEGAPRSRVVVIEFPSYQAAVECYHSPEYAKAMALRVGKSVMDLAIVPGYDGPQPGDAS